ncbi:MAG TPA: Gfo/Idh/MocA family oxidoreductase [Armatimonadota bacterium]|jgi:predicted dehydrogenase
MMSTTNPIRIGLVGVGRAGWGMHCEELRERSEKFQFVAACDVLPERCAKMAERYGCRTYSAIEDLLADPAVELVDIATRSCDHFAHAALALQAGKTVFLEKPICLTHDEAVQLHALAAQSPGQLYPRHNRRFEPAFQHIREIMASGILGDIYEIKLRRVGFQRRNDWQTIKEFGGGQLLNWGPHIIDHALCLLDAPVKRIWSDLQCIAAAGDAEDHLKILLTGTNGRLVDLEISGGAAIAEPEYLLWGTKGALTCNGETLTMKYLDPHVTLEPCALEPGTPGTGGFSNQEALSWVETTMPVQPKTGCDTDSIWDALYLAIRDGKPFDITLSEAVLVMQVITAAKHDTVFA